MNFLQVYKKYNLSEYFLHSLKNENEIIQDMDDQIIKKFTWDADLYDMVIDFEVMDNDEITNQLEKVGCKVKWGYSMIDDGCEDGAGDNYVLRQSCDITDCEGNKRWVRFYFGDYTGSIGYTEVNESFVHNLKTEKKMKDDIDDSLVDYTQILHNLLRKYTNTYFKQYKYKSSLVPRTEAICFKSNNLKKITYTDKNGQKHYLIGISEYLGGIINLQLNWLSEDYKHLKYEGEIDEKISIDEKPGAICYKRIKKDYPNTWDITAHMSNFPDLNMFPKEEQKQIVLEIRKIMIEEKGA